MKNLEKLLALDVSSYTEQKAGLTYLSWANAWREFVKVYPQATYTIHKSDTGECWFGNPSHGYMVYTSVTAEGITHEMWLPVMDFKNKSMLTPTTFDINKAVMRCLTKNLAMFGLGLYIYAGEDLPEEETITQAEADEFKDKLAKADKPLGEVLKWAKIKRVEDMPRSKYEVLMKKL